MDVHHQLAKLVNVDCLRVPALSFTKKSTFGVLKLGLPW